MSDGVTEPGPSVGGSGGQRRARFAGCALCHQVQWHDYAVPVITAPATPDRWLPRASFNHAMHTSMACADCHAAARSERTSDVILPNRESCAKCHSPEGGAAHACASCHLYHNPAPPALAARGLTASLP